METESVILNNKVKYAATFNVLKEYVDYLYEEKLVDNKAAAKEYVGKVISPALDCGAVDSNLLDEICTWIDRRVPSLQSIKNQQLQQQHMLHAVETLVAHSNDDADFNRYMELKDELAAVEKRLVSRYSETISSSERLFIEDYKNLFDKSFIAKII